MRAALALLLLTLPAHAARKAKPAAAPPPPAEVATRLLAGAMGSSEAYDELGELCDTVGARLAGSQQLDRAIAWGAARMREDGLSVRTEPVQVPRWIRGPAAAWIEGEPPRSLEVLALGGSVSTPAGGVDAPVLVVSSFDELEARAPEAVGRIVVYNAPFTTYGETVRYRWDGPSRAARVGAIASLTRSVTPVSLYTPHTGNQRYADDVTPIPAAAITVEDAAHLARLAARGVTPTVHLELEAHLESDAPSFNVLGELRGRALPDEVVVLGCHLDSWDVGEGAQDDGAGCVTVMQAAALLAELPVAPRRTVRVVLYTNEENGLRGGKAYQAAHAGERTFAAVEDDTGSGAPLGFEIDGEGDAPEEQLKRLVEQLAPLRDALATVGADHFELGGSGADIGPLVEHGAIGLGLSHDMTGYWPIHHTRADTFDKVDPALVQRNVAAMALIAWGLAELAEAP